MVAAPRQPSGAQRSMGIMLAWPACWLPYLPHCLRIVDPHSQHPGSTSHPLPVPAQPPNVPSTRCLHRHRPQAMSSNIFAALAKSKSKKKPKADSDDKQQSAEADKHAELEAAIFSAPSGALASNWADSEEEEEEDEEWGAPQSHGNEEGWEEVRGSLGIAGWVPGLPGNAHCPCWPATHPPSPAACAPRPAGQGRLHGRRSQLRAGDAAAAGAGASERERGGGGLGRHRRCGAATACPAPGRASCLLTTHPPALPPLQSDDDGDVDIEAELGIEVTKTDDEESSDDEEEEAPRSAEQRQADAAAAAAAAKAAAQQLSKKVRGRAGCSCTLLHIPACWSQACGSFCAAQLRWQACMPRPCSCQPPSPARPPTSAALPLSPSYSGSSTLPGLQEQKKKELEDLDAVLAELGLEAKEEAAAEAAPAVDAEAAAAAAAKAAKRKAKKAQQGGGAATNGNGAASADSSAENKVGAG